MHDAQKIYLCQYRHINALENIIILCNFYINKLRSVNFDISEHQKGIVKKITWGDVNSEVVLELPGGQEMVSVITTNSVKRLGLEEGKKAKAFVKASSVMMIVDD